MMKQLSGWRGKILKIDLSSETFSAVEPGIDLYKKFIGGRGLAGHYLRPFCHLPWDSPDVPLLFFTGPLVDTASPASGRFSVMSISPLTDAIGHSSAGGRFGTELKRAGWDGIIITGRSERLRGIRIRDNAVEFYDAEKLRGMPLSMVFSALPEKGAAAASGPAAENGVLFSGITFSGEFSAGRTGLGLVMTAKGLKYIHIEGTGVSEAFNRAELDSGREDILRLTSASPFLMGELGISQYGTGALYDLISSRRMMPAYNFRATYFPGAERMNAHAYRERYGMTRGGCSGCHILCKKYADDGRSIPEYETMSHFSALIGNSDIEIVMEANRLCNEYGMDTISAASVISCYMEINNIHHSEIDIIKTLRSIAESDGDGALLKSGSRRYAASAGYPEVSMSVKGLDLPAYDPRGAYGMALAYVTSTWGGCHLGAYTVSHEVLRKPVATDRFSFSGKARIIKLAEDLYAAVDSLTACRFIFLAASLEEYSRVFNAVTGLPVSGNDLMAAGERIFYNERIMNSIRGFTSSDDDLPARFFSFEGSTGGGIKVPPLNREEFLEARSRYYRIRGLTPDGGPVEDKCRELDLQWIR